MKDKVLEILKDLHPESDFENGGDFIENGYLDSFDVVTLVSELEDAFDIAISALDILPENFCSLDAISALIVRSPNRARISG